MQLIHRQTVTVATVALLLVASGCAGGEEPSNGAKKKAQSQQAQSAEGPAPLPAQLPCEPEGAALQITALKAVAGKLPAYDKGCLAVPAGEDFTINLTNDDMLEHNVSIYLKDGANFSDGVFHGELFRGPGEEKTYEVPPITEPGVYAFRCDEHLSNMKGVFVVTG
jgi:plastocyanin